ncbi:TAT-dependent nitrous-oxide reductase (plasmid) [Cupriavidus necator H16]|uniref:Nitrous-oxide reductase n=2 Tax=Cupriavidus necator (strain ATCC 17699 / DSM 428 / KCTC 22496 / NCIMB 10442 / H16 / Stanier 337) TaxID=381666 RepID=NOSZ_CUPNH|nr:TAT-dependent nitrous-oxide reductase [Cupriavidus necator]Q59105.1 RecName: Full=Nitrous-oxide reductase; AltName: Full=N(2)OR; AltName: Full=N2O reductase; Flags: Precursor [Cupriavidus necator H16]AAP86001.1 nitrous oxide reductase [Cupriavidus necator H16]QCC05484.1 nitrous-oxide reductase [Cupriavidus necator H16]QQB81306.1 nitrous-oxide reductase [Cupriavidus necator]CAA46383.1 nitrous-oxide reductase [Cupriavidus necator H16]
MSKEKASIGNGPGGIGRRQFLGTAALAGLAGVVACTDKGAAPAAAAVGAPASGAHGAAHGAGASVHLKPGELDTYYGLWSGGHTGDMRVLGLPSGREILRIPCFVPDALVGWGITNESKKVMGARPDGTLRYTVADTHHTHASYKDGNYDGRYAWVNDKINSRIARIRLDYFICDKITELPNVQGFHGIFPDKRDPVDTKINYTTRVFCGGEFGIPLPSAPTEDAGKYRSLFTCVDAETMAVRWQVLIDGNCDLVATSYDGKLAATNQYNTENGAHFEDMMSAERDACVFFNIARIEAAVQAGKFKTYGDSKVPVVDGTQAANKDPKTALTAYVSVPKNPHGVNASPDQKYFICAGKLSPTATVIELSRVLGWFDGKQEKLDDAIVAEVELGLGPLHTAFDGRGNAYTTLFLDSQLVKWNLDAAIKFHKGDKNAKYVVDRLDLQYQPGHVNASQSETVAADGKYLAVGCKFSKDRFLPVGPLHPENEQLIDISGQKMVLMADHPVRGEPHDFIIFKRELVRPKQVYALDDFPLAIKDPKESGVFRNGRKVTVKITSQAPAFSLREFKLKKGDEVTLILTNLDKIEDLTHGFAIPKYNVNFIVNPQETASVTFVADKPGVFWCYCTHFCHALHLEMRTRMIVEA